MRIAKRTDSAVSMSTSGTGAAMGCEHLIGYSITIAVTATSGTLAGDFTLEGSNDAFTDNVNNNANSSATWVGLNNTTASISTTTTTSVLYNISDVQYGAYRIKWTRSSGLGSYTAYHLAKGNQS